MDLTESFKLIKKDGAVPEGTDLSIVITDSAMEPLIRRGQTVYVSCRTELRERDVGLFLHEGRVLCRRWREDYAGALILLGGTDRVDDCIYLDREQRKRCLCLGKVLV